MKIRRVLAIDGGGIKGLLPALFLKEFEANAEQPIYKLFDVIAGTSTGAIIALGLTRPETPLTATECIELYTERGTEIFPTDRYRWRKNRVLTAVTRNTYDAGPLEHILQEIFGDTRLSDCLTETLVVATEPHYMEMHIFSRHLARSSRENDYLIRNVARATSAAQTFFPPATIPNEAGTTVTLTDGGTSANNPAERAFRHCKRLFPDDEFLVVSLGTGAVSTTRPTAQSIERAMNVQNLPDVIQLQMEVGSKRVHSDLAFDLPTVNLHEYCEFRRYYRFQGNLEPEMEDMDNAAEENIDRLKCLGQELIHLHEETIRFLAKKLKKLGDIV